MNVLVNGGGNIGTTLVSLLVKYKNVLGIDQLGLLKSTHFDWKNQDLNIIKNAGVTLYSPNDFNSILPKTDYIFETTRNGKGKANKEIYQTFPHIKSCAQGSEKGFGTPYMSGLNDGMIRKAKFVHIVSCNTHGAASILQSICKSDFSQIISADFVVVRRSEDLGNHERLVSANVVARHLDDTIGTHHAIDVVDMFNTIDVKFPITSSDITTPSQLMHSTRFNLVMNNFLTQDEINTRFNESQYIATTNKFDSNLVFELGRRYGFHGRIFSHAIIVVNNLLLNENRISGWAFVPQEGNTLISTLHAFMLQMDINDFDEKLEIIKKDLLFKEF